MPLFDGLGAERTVTAASQSVTGPLTTEGYGRTVATTGSSSNPYMFAATSGYRNDGDAGLMHVGARYYDAQVGRFITRDTVLSEHPYIYRNADPVSWVDPTGHESHTSVFLGWGFGAGSGAYGGNVSAGLVIDDDGNVGLRAGILVGVGYGLGVIHGPELELGSEPVTTGVTPGLGAFGFAAIGVGALVKGFWPGHGLPGVGGGMHGGNIGEGVGAGGWVGGGTQGTLGLFNVVRLWRWIRDRF